MTRRNLTIMGLTVAAALLLFGGVALAREQQTREDHSAPIGTQAATQVAATFDDHGVDASRSPELQASDDHGVDASESPELQASDDHGVDASESPELQASDDHGGQGANDQPKPSASPSFDDKTPKASANPTSSIDDGGHGGNY
jgi:hypothetical protein